MSHNKKPIEEFFLEAILKLSLAAIIIVIIADIYFTRFAVPRSLIVNSTVLISLAISLVLYKNGLFKTSVFVIGFLIMGAMFYQSIEADSITTSSMAVVMVVGFGFSVLLKKQVSMYLHYITLAGMVAVFAWLAAHPLRYGKPDSSDIIVAGITYLVLYGIIAYSSLVLKHRYDETFQALEQKNIELFEKSNEIETQNEELIQSQENLFQLNNHLEQIVQERTEEIEKKNERLIRYAYSNAHHLRGPVARVLGLIHLSKLENSLDYPFLFQKIEEQTKEIDEVVKSINKELEV
jgi:hypothetical protein